jgi:AMP-polyphosphate phosphotransferase
MAKRHRLEDVDLSPHLEDQAYEEHLQKAQYRLRSVELAYYHQKRRGIVVFEGWDAAGKGGAIRRMSAVLDPRGFKVWPIAAPDAHDQARHYLYRFWARIPEPGTIAVFDRSWYGRVLVERVEGLVSRAAWTRAYGEINEFEDMLLDDGVRMVKIFIHISYEKQVERFIERTEDPYKRWKMTPDDLRNLQRRRDYERAIDEMLAKTWTRQAPWHLVSGENKNHARVRILNLIADELGRGVDLRPPPLDPEVARLAPKMLGAKVKRKRS